MAAMRRREFLTRAAAGAAGAGALAACGETPGGAPGTAAGGVVVDGPQVSWRCATSFPRSLDFLHGAAEYTAERVRALTGGRFTIRVYPAGELVPGLQVMDAVQQGTVQCGFTGDYYYIGKSPALAFGSSVPFGLTMRQQYAWLLEGGGLELLREVYADFGVLNFLCGGTGAQMGGWFRRPVNSLADLRGLRMRIPGLGGEIMTRLGVSVQVLAGGDIFPALERGAIDATEWVGPYDDEKLGFHEIAPNYYYPGWWEPGLAATMQVSLAAWEQLPELYQEAFRAACGEATAVTQARYDAANPEALARLVDERGVTLQRFSDEIMEAALRESEAYLEEQAARDATFGRVYEQWRDFRDRSYRYFGGVELAYQEFAFPRV